MFAHSFEQATKTAKMKSKTGLTKHPQWNQRLMTQFRSQAFYSTEEKALIRFPHRCPWAVIADECLPNCVATTYFLREEFFFFFKKIWNKRNFQQKVVQLKK